VSGRRPRLAWLALACLLLGVGLLVPFEEALPVALGIVLLLAFVVLGTAAIVRPEYLAGEPAEDPDDR
jgi:hypothetical protein